MNTKVIRRPRTFQPCEYGFVRFAHVWAGRKQQAYVMDDFGNSVPVVHAQILTSLRCSFKQVH